MSSSGKMWGSLVATQNALENLRSQEPSFTSNQSLISNDRTSSSKPSSSYPVPVQAETDVQGRMVPETGLDSSSQRGQTSILLVSSNGDSQASETNSSIPSPPPLHASQLFGSLPEWRSLQRSSSPYLSSSVILGHTNATSHWPISADLSTAPAIRRLSTNAEAKLPATSGSQIVTTSLALADEETPRSSRIAGKVKRREFLLLNWRSSSVESRSPTAVVNGERLDSNVSDSLDAASTAACSLAPLANASRNREASDSAGERYVSQGSNNDKMNAPSGHTLSIRPNDPDGGIRITRVI